MDHPVAKRVAGLAVIALLIEGPAIARDFNEITSSQEIRLGYVIYPPLMNRDPKTGQITGLIPDALTAALAPTKLKLTWVEVSWSTFAAALQSDQIDVFAGATFATPTRALSLSFTEPYAYAGNTLVVRKADAEGRFKGFSTWQEFDRPDITVATLIGGQSYEWAKAHFTKAKVVGLQSTDPNAHSLEVLAGRADVAYAEASAAIRFVAAQSDQVVNLLADKPFNITPYTWAVKLNSPALLAFLNTTVEYMAANGTWDDLEKGTYEGQLSGIFHIRRPYYQAGDAEVESKNR
jgi:polar amino acid transport system substrate-binding protein